jgi:hypothetical protein
MRGRALKIHAYVSTSLIRHEPKSFLLRKTT